MKLLIDQGNTRTKLAIVENNKIIDLLASTNLHEDEFYNFLKNKEITTAVYASVGNMPAFLDEYCKRFAIDIKSLVIKDDKQQNKLQNMYGFYDSLGADLLAISLYANYIGGNHPTLSISLGSCITCEVVEANGKFIGNSISPGMTMRAKAMHQFTKDLPLIEIHNKMRTNTLSTISFSKNTTKAMLKGIVSGIEGELLKNISDFKTNYPTGKIFITGGDAQYFTSIPTVEFVEDMVLKGLNLLEIN